MVLAQVADSSVGGSSFLVQLIIAITPLVLGILTVLVKQFAATKALKKSEERTKLAFGVVDEKLMSLNGKVENLVSLHGKVENLELALQDIQMRLSSDELSQLVDSFCDKKLSTVIMTMNELGQQVSAIAEKLNVVSISSEADRATIEFRKSYFLKVARVPDMFPTNKSLMNTVNQFFVDYMNLVEEVIFNLNNWATKDVVKSMFDVKFAEMLSNLVIDYGTEFSGLVKKLLSADFKKSVCDIVGIVFDIANLKKSRIYGVALAFVELSLSLWLKAYQEYLMKYSEEPGGSCVDDRAN